MEPDMKYGDGYIRTLLSMLRARQMIYVDFNKR